jgi:hypothetical protein
MKKEGMFWLIGPVQIGPILYSCTIIFLKIYVVSILFSEVTYVAINTMVCHG